MNKKSLHVVLAIASVIILFGTSAICNQCSNEEDTATALQTEITQEETNKETAASATLSESEETIAGTTNSSTGTTTISSGTTAPTIDLEIYEGPAYASSDGKCYYRIKAVVTGNPGPTVAFSKDDSFGAWGPLRCQVNLEDPADTYTLTATATNSQGSATDSIIITWGCSEEVITTPETGAENTVVFNPSICGTVGSAPGEATTGQVAFGDSAANTDWAGLFAFDVSSLTGKEIKDAKLKVANPTYYSECGFKGDICIGYMDFLPGITQSDYTSSTSYGFPECFPWDSDPIEFSTSFLEDKVEERASAGTELQFQIAYALTTTGGLPDVAEGRIYQPDDITLTVTYIE